jgi:hypothetical protein
VAATSASLLTFGQKRDAGLRTSGADSASRDEFDQRPSTGVSVNRDVEEVDERVFLNR